MRRVILVYSAHAFRWVAPETRWTNVAAALSPWWSHGAAAAGYLAHLTTQSSHRMLQDEERDELVEQREAVLPDQVVLGMPAR